MNPAEMQAAIFASFPEWRELAQHEIDSEQQPYMFVELPAPVEADANDGLYVSTANGEFTVGFDDSHRHFNYWLPFDDDGYVYEGAIEQVQAIMKEEEVSVSWWLNDQWRCSGFRPITEIARLPSSLAEGAYNYKRIRSWRGTHNADIRK